MEEVMKNFQYHNPTKIIYGAGEYKSIGIETARFGKKVLLVTGQGSLKKSGYFDKIVAFLKKQGLEVFILEGVKSNPRLELCLKGAEMCREKGIEVIAAVGGGSVLDTAKTIAVAALDDGDVWEFFLTKRKITGALPIVTMVTMAATGSEFNTNAVINNEKTGQKYAIHSEHIFPRVSILDPLLTVSLPKDQTAYGAVDILSHILEGYQTAQGYAPLSDRIAEAAFRETMVWTERVLEKLDDVEARGNLLWCSTVALGGWTWNGWGETTFHAHTIEHEISAATDCAHGAGLAVVMPAVMRFHVKKRAAKIAQITERVLGVSRSWKDTDEEVALRGVKAFKHWIRSIGCPVTLAELGIKSEELPLYAQKILKNPEAGELIEAAILEILGYAWEW
jgi:alcohol dehydrogenase YqhD (iron-dependent ADH family)